MDDKLTPEAVAQMVADLDLFSRCGDVGVMDRDMAIDAKAMLTTLAAENATLRASEAAALESLAVMKTERDTASELAMQWSIKAALTPTADKEPKT